MTDALTGGIGSGCRVQDQLLGDLAGPPPFTTPVIIKGGWPDRATTGCFILGKGGRRISPAPAFTRLCCCTRMGYVPKNTIFTIANGCHSAALSESFCHGKSCFPSLCCSSDRPATEWGPTRIMLLMKRSYCSAGWPICIVSSMRLRVILIAVLRLENSDEKRSASASRRASLSLARMAFRSS